MPLLYDSSARARLLAVLFAFGACGALACSKKSSGAADPAAANPGGASPSTSSTSATAPNPPPAASGVPPWERERKSPLLATRLAEERASRPLDTPRVEAVFAAFTRAGVPVHGQFQHLASPIYAKYCMSAKTEHEIAMSVCEYESAAMAIKGKDESNKAFGSIPNRDIYVNKGTTLTLLQDPKTPASEAEYKLLVSAFGAL